MYSMNEGFSLQRYDIKPIYCHCNGYHVGGAGCGMQNCRWYKLRPASLTSHVTLNNLSLIVHSFRSLVNVDLALDERVHSQIRVRAISSLSCCLLCQSPETFVNGERGKYGLAGVWWYPGQSYARAFCSAVTYLSQLYFASVPKTAFFKGNLKTRSAATGLKWKFYMLFSCHLHFVLFSTN